MDDDPVPTLAPGHAEAGQGFDKSQPDVRFIALFGAGMLALLAAILLGLQFFYDRAMEQQVYVRVLAPESEMLLALRAREDEELNSYRYLDRDKGVVRLPVARAMELLQIEYAQGKLPYPTTPAPAGKPLETKGGGNASPAPVR